MKQHYVGGFRNSIIFSRCPPEVREEMKDCMEKKAVKQRTNSHEARFL